LVWAALMFELSTGTFGPSFSRGLLAMALQGLHLSVSSGTFDLLHAILRKLAHLTEYGILALLLYSLPGEEAPGLWRPRRAVLCVLVAAAYSLTDEFHQLFVPGRHASLRDCGLDTIGAALAMVVPYTQEQIALVKTHTMLSGGYSLAGNGNGLNPKPPE